MKKALLFLTAAAGMLLLGGASAKADDGTTLELKASEGTFTASYVSSSYYYKWESTTEPVITILDGTSNNNMQATNTDDFVMYEGQSNMTHDYTVSVEDGYVITGMTVTVTTEKDDMTVTVGTVSNTLTANTAANYEMSGLWRQSVGITITSAENGNEGATFSNWTVTVQPDIDLSKMKITSIGEAITTLPVEGTWYLIENEKGGYTPAGDTGEGNAITRASSADAVQEGDFVMDVMQYMLGFHPTALASAEQPGVGNVCNLQFATGNYWVSAYGYSQAQTIATTSSLESAGNYNVYLTQTGGTTFALNAYDMEKKVDNNGVGGALVGWDSGYNTSTSGNNVWVLYPLELELLSEDEEAEEELVLEIEALISEAQATYDNYDGGYDLNVETGFSGSDGVGNGLITQNSQFTSNATSTEGSINNLLDNDASTYWHSDYSISHENGEVYLQVAMADDFVGGPLMLNFVRRNDTYNNQVTKMSVKDGDDALIDTLYLPYGSMGETVKVGFTCPYGVKTLRFYEEETVGQSQYNAGIWHVADFQLFYTYMYPDLNSTHSEAASALQSAIAAAQTAADGFSVTENDIETLSTAIQTYLTALSDYTVSWTLGANYGTLILPFEADVPSGLTAYTTSGVSDNELQLTSVSDGKLSANTPYIISGTASTACTFTGLPAITGGLSDGYLVGNFEENFAAPVGSYVLQNQTGTPAFYLVNSETTITVAPYHCYLDLTLSSTGTDAPAKAVVYFPSSGVATAIEAVETAAETGSEAIYDLSGRKVTNPRSGIYIKGGKKVIIK